MEFVLAWPSGRSALFSLDVLSSVSIARDSLESEGHLDAGCSVHVRPVARVSESQVEAPLMYIWTPVAVEVAGPMGWSSSVSCEDLGDALGGGLVPYVGHGL